MKIAALDVGDLWTGIALSDALGMLAKPYKTVATDTLLESLTTLFEQERISEVIIGHPKTLKGTTSDQTKKVEETAELLKTSFPRVSWRLWDERLSSKRADSHKKDRSKEEKLRSHSIAAAFILDSYLSYLHIQKNVD